jgi:predicted transcriptional regulator
MDKRVSFRLDTETALRLRTEARQRKTTMTAIIKEAIREEWKRLSKQSAAAKLSGESKH